MKDCIRFVIKQVQIINAAFNYCERRWKIRAEVQILLFYE